MESVTVNGVLLEYEAIGSGEPVLLISPVIADGFLPLLSQPRWQIATSASGARTSPGTPAAQRSPPSWRWSVPSSCTR